MKHAVALLMSMLAVGSVSALAQSPCKVTRENFVNHGSASATMTLEQGQSCAFTFRFGGQLAPDSWKLVASPKSGEVTFKEDIAEYRPAADFTGEDTFAVEVFGRAPNCGTRCERNGRYDVTVSVTPRR
jgi:hypothetical protein